MIAAAFDSLAAFAVALMIALLLLALVPVRRRWLLAAALVFATATVFLPVLGSTLHVAIRSVVAPLGASFYLLAASGSYAFVRGRAAVAPRNEAVFAALIAVAGAALYLSAFGFIRADLYRLGFDNRVVVALAIVLLATGVLLRSWMTIGWVALAAAMKAVGAVDSANAFDHFIDPLAWIVGVTLAFTHALARYTPWTFPYLGYRMSARPGRPRGAAAKRQAAV